MSTKSGKEKDVLFLNLDYGIGTGIVVNSEIYYGKSGYAGEFGHIPFFDNEIICHCGKKGCLETEASGWAMERMFKERLADSTSIVVTKYGTKPEDVKMEDIIRAVNDDDFMSIELIAEIGENLGKGIAILINLFNPELVILGGALATTKDYICLPIKSAINKYSLSLVNNDTKVVMSRLGDSAGIVGACLLVRDRLLVKE
jgi:predicted NBD/HSP70 family sugar kinase